MGKRILPQRKGRGSVGSLKFKALDHLKVGPVKYPRSPKYVKAKVIKGVISKFIHEPGRRAPLAQVKLEDGTEFLYLPPRGVFLGQTIQIGYDATPAVGNILPLSTIPDGTQVCNVELVPGDGGKLVRSSGCYATIFAHEGEKVILRLRSRREKVLDGNCRATIGQVAGGGRVELPFLKAGTKYYAMKKRVSTWPRVRGVAMNVASHPFGGGSHRHPGRPTTVSRNAPPGQKVGHIAAKWTGRKRRRGQKG